MANQIAGEVDLEIGGLKWTVKLNLGTLAELENVFEVDSFEDALNMAFGGEAGKVSARHLRSFLQAVLKGNGIKIDDEASKAVNNITPADLMAITGTLTKMMDVSGLSEKKDGGEVEKPDAPLPVAVTAGSSG